MITTTDQAELTSWLCERIGLIASPNMRCIGRLNSENKLIGVVGFDGYNGTSVMMHVAGEGNWISRNLLAAAFDYPFRVMGCNVVLGSVPSGNVAAQRLNLRLGFRTDAEIPGGHPDGALYLMSMQRYECRWIAQQPVQQHAMQHRLH